jgi:anaerobic selenocysteine-containing dehydrogenase
MTSTIHHRACNLCEAICGLEITVENGKVTHIEGDKNDPLSKGYLCPKAFALKDIYEDPNRLKQPIRRLADGTWETIGWDLSRQPLSTQLGNDHEFARFYQKFEDKKHFFGDFA